MIKSKNIIPLFAFAVVLIVYSCSEDSTDPNACETIGITYTNETSGIINSSCAISGCHAIGGQSPLLEDYASASTASSQENFLGSIRHETGYSAMPPGSMLDECQIDILEAWIADGSPE